MLRKKNQCRHRHTCACAYTCKAINLDMYALTNWTPDFRGKWSPTLWSRGQQSGVFLSNGYGLFCQCSSLVFFASVFQKCQSVRLADVFRGFSLGPLDGDHRLGMVRCQLLTSFIGTAPAAPQPGSEEKKDPDTWKNHVEISSAAQLFATLPEAFGWSCALNTLLLHHKTYFFKCFYLKPGCCSYVKSCPKCKNEDCCWTNYDTPFGAKGAQSRISQPLNWWVQ